MIAYLRGEAGGQLVRDVLRDPAHRCFAHVINLCEVYYEFHRAEGESVAVEALQDLEAAGVARREDNSVSFCQAVGALKATRRRISLADCFAVTLANTVNGTLLSADHHEFDSLAASGECKVALIR
jgi:predicted nucleic acid-binding protein